MPNTREKAAKWFADRAADTPMPGARAMFEIAAEALQEKTVQEWISVKDRLPEDASTVLAIDSDGTISSAYYVGRWHSGGDLDEDAVTHWMPLPEPPKEVE
jgi:hypothetical protein